MVTWQFWTLIGAFLVVSFDLSSGVDKIAVELVLMNVTLSELARTRRKALLDVPPPSPVPAES